MQQKIRLIKGVCGKEIKIDLHHNSDIPTSFTVEGCDRYVNGASTDKSLTKKQVVEDFCKRCESEF